MIRLGIRATTPAALLVSVAAACAAAAGASASAGSAVPRAGDWEGSGSHGLPLSFGLARRHGHLVATGIAIGAPRTCPAIARNAEAVPLSAVSYSGPGAVSANGSSRAVLSGRVPRHSGSATLSGSFTSARRGTFSIHIRKSVRHCGWPRGALTWHVHLTRRPAVADRAWTVSLTGPGITAGRVKVVVASRGRIVDSFRGSFSCQSPDMTGKVRVDAVPAWEFIHPGGRFYSPTRGNTIKGHPTTWKGRFSQGALTGALSIYDPCTKKLVQARFGPGVSP